MAKAIGAAAPRVDFSSVKPGVAAPLARSAAAGAEEAFAANGCGGCHAIRGTAAAGTIGPDLTHFGARTSLAAGVLPMTERHIARFIRDAPEAKPGARMPAYRGMPAAEARAIARYLKGLT